MRKTVNQVQEISVSNRRFVASTNVQVGLVAGHTAMPPQLSSAKQFHRLGHFQERVMFGSRLILVASPNTSQRTIWKVWPWDSRRFEMDFQCASE